MLYNTNKQNVGFSFLVPSLEVVTVGQSTLTGSAASVPGTEQDVDGMKGFFSVCKIYVTNTDDQLWFKKKKKKKFYF